MKTHNLLVHSLLKSGPITNDSIYRAMGTHRGSARIHDLQKQGVDIESEYVKRGRAWVKLYSLAGWKPSYVEPGV